MPTPKKRPYIKIHKADTYYVFWHDDQARMQKRESLGTKDAAEAEVRFSAWLNCRQAAQKVDLTVSDALAYYLEHRAFRSELSLERARTISRHLDRFFGDLQVSDLTKAHSRSYNAQREAAPGTIRRELGCLTTALHFCYKDEMIDRVPSLELPPLPPPRDRWLALEEIDRLIAAAKSLRKTDRMTRAERFIWIGLETGARHDSIVGLAWSRVDFEQGFIDFRDPKKIRTDKRQAVVAISDRLLPILKQAYQERTNDIWVLDRRRNVSYEFRKVADAAGMPEVTPHTLRHTCATQLARQGVPMWAIAQILGDNINTVSANYLHHDPDHVRQYLNMERS